MSLLSSLPRWVGQAAVLVLLCPWMLGGPAGSATASAEGSASDVHTADDASRDLAWSWVRSMLSTPTIVMSSSSITPERAYPADWTGPVRGTFQISGVTAPEVIPPAVTLDPDAAAHAADPGYRGVITGRVTLPPQPGGWILQAYRNHNGERSQVPLQGLAGADGAFTLDLSGIGAGPGNWEFGVLDASAGYLPVGDPWPSAGTYRDWEIRSFATTDRRYPIGVQPAAVDGSFRFANSAPGTKTFQLVARGSPDSDSPDRVLAESAPATGLVRSFARPVHPAGDDQVRSYAYDQALALQSALVMDDLGTARILVRGLIALQEPTGAQAGAFVAAAPQSNPAGGEPIYRTGNTAIALYALLSYLRRAGEADPESAAVRTAANRAVDWLLGQQLTSGAMAGLVTGGWGEIGPAGVDPFVRLTFASTEHNLDAWQALSRARQVLGCGRCAPAADALQHAILTILWDQSRSGFTQGMRPEGRDTVDPLDVNSWGAILLDAVGRSDLAATSLGRTAAFAVSDRSLVGFLAFRAQPAMPHPVPSVWLEGSFGVALAQARHGNATGYATTMAGLAGAQRSDGSLPMASSTDPDRELSTVSSVAATTWFILAGRPDHPDSLWSAPGHQAAG